MLGLKLNHVSKRGHRLQLLLQNDLDGLDELCVFETIQGNLDFIGTFSLPLRQHDTDALSSFAYDIYIINSVAWFACYIKASFDPL